MNNRSLPIIALVIILLIIWIISSCDKCNDLPDCPFPILVFKKIKVTDENLSIEFAAQLELDLNKLKKKINAEKVTGRLESSITKSIKKYEETIWGGDAVFIGFYNAYTSITCGKWALFKEDASDENKVLLNESITAIQNFVDQYYVDNKKEDYRKLAGKDMLMSKIDELKESVKESKIFDGITKKNYFNKIEFMKSGLSSIRPLKATGYDFKKFSEVEDSFDKLLIDFKNDKKF